MYGENVSLVSPSRDETRFIMILSGKSIVLAIASTTSLNSRFAAGEFSSISSRLLEGACQ